MIWIRRIVSILLGLVFVVLLLVTLVISQVNQIFLNPDFYPRQLKKADVYNFLLVDVLTSILDDARELEPRDFEVNIDENPLVTSGLTTVQIVDAVNRAFPPEYLESMVELSLDQIGRYITAERDEFTIKIQAGNNVRSMVEEFKHLMAEADIYNLILKQEAEPRIRDVAIKALTEDKDTPGWVFHLLGIQNTDGKGSVEDVVERLTQVIMRIVTPEWVQSQFESVLDEVSPYLVGESTSFEIRVRTTDEQVAIALKETKSILREANAYDLLYTEVIEPAVRDSIVATIILPYGIEVSADEVIDALMRVAPPAWVRDQAELLIDEAAAYITGTSDRILVEIALTDNKLEAESVIEELVNAKLVEIIDGLPECRTRADILAAGVSLKVGLPSCIPRGVSSKDVLDRASIAVTGTIQQLVLSPVPNLIKFTDSQLRSGLTQAGGMEYLELHNYLRSILGDGWSYSSDEMRADLAANDEDALDILENIRAFLGDGYIYTHMDFRRDLVNIDIRNATGGKYNALVWIDNSRDWFDLSHQYPWIIYGPMLILLFVIGVLGGNTWSGRIGWVCISLLISSGTIFIIFGPAYGAFAGLGFDTARDEVIQQVMTHADDDFKNTSLLIADKIRDLAELIMDEFAGGIRQSSFNLGAIALVTYFLSLIWVRLTGPTKRFLHIGKESVYLILP